MSKWDKKLLHCLYCGKEYYVSPCFEKTSKFCSSECYHNASKKEYEKVCAGCGKKFKHSARHKDRKYCSYECFSEHKRNDPPNRTEGKSGYIYVWMTDGSGIPEHRYVMEEYLGRELLSTEHVHHIDFDRTNNKIENLMIVSRGEHSKLHREHEKAIGKPLFGRNE